MEKGKNLHEKERTFYDLRDREVIIKSTTDAYKTDMFSIFYPLGNKRYNFEEYLSPKVIEEIRKLANGNPDIASKTPKILEALDALANNKTAEGIIRSYTLERLSFMLDHYLRTDTEQGLCLFKEYLFCLKASIYQMETPVVEKNKKLYSGFNLKEGIQERCNVKLKEEILISKISIGTKLHNN
jgi:hypothetical protein